MTTSSTTKITITRKGTYIPKELTTKLTSLSNHERTVGLYICERMYSYNNEYQILTVEEIQKGYKNNDGELVIEGTGFHEKSIKKAIKGLVEKGLFLVYSKKDRISIDDDIYFFAPEPKYKLLVEYLVKTQGENFYEFRRSFFSKKIDIFLTKMRKNFLSLKENFIPKEEQKILIEEQFIPLNGKDIPLVVAEAIDKSIDTEVYNNKDINKKNNTIKTSTIIEEKKVKTSSENLEQESNNDDDDFLKNFDKNEEEKSNTVIEVLEEKNDKVDSSKSNKYETDKPDLTHTQKSSGGAGATCGQNVDKLRDELIILFDNTDIDEDFRDKILAKYSKEYELIKKGLELMSCQENIKNQTGWLNRFLEKKGEGYVFPKSFYVNQEKEKEKKEADLYTKIGNLWGYIGKVHNIHVAFMEINKIISNLVLHKKIDEIKEKIQETSKLINPYEVIKKDYLELTGVI